jgi:hypothetical protein
LDEKIEKNEVKVRKDIHWEWDVTLKAEIFTQNKVCEYNYNVWKNFGIQANHIVMLWEVQDINNAIESPKGSSVGHCMSCHSLLESCGDNISDELI